jgi:hypothetical protein
MPKDGYATRSLSAAGPSNDHNNNEIKTKEAKNLGWFLMPCSYTKEQTKTKLDSAEISRLSGG